MGANPTQARALVLFIIAFVVIAAALAADVNYLLLLLGLAGLGGSVALFLKCKPWEHIEE